MKSQMGFGFTRKQELEVGKKYLLKFERGRFGGTDQWLQTETHCDLKAEILRAVTVVREIL